jgi:hypothetical protein
LTIPDQGFPNLYQVAHYVYSLWEWNPKVKDFQLFLFGLPSLNPGPSFFPSPTSSPLIILPFRHIPEPKSLISMFHLYETRP